MTNTMLGFTQEHHGRRIVVRSWAHWTGRTKHRNPWPTTMNRHQHQPRTYRTKVRAVLGPKECEGHILLLHPLSLGVQCSQGFLWVLLG